MANVRANCDEIFAHLRGLLGEEAVTVARAVAAQYIAGGQKNALEKLKMYDATLGGIGIYRSKGRKLPGIYRALSYNEIPMLHGHAHENARTMIHASCGYLEELIKKLVFLWPWEVIKVEGVPLGALIKKIEKRLPPDLAQELGWLNHSVGVFAKHHFNLEMEKRAGNDLDRYFELDEALAVYFIARVLGTRIEALSGKPQEAFLEGWELAEWKSQDTGTSRLSAVGNEKVD